MNTAYHIPVLLHDSVNALITDPAGVYVDATFGGGGHSREILSRLNGGKLLAFDQDGDAELNAAEFKLNPNFQFVRSNFAYIKNFLRLAEVLPADGLLADLGVSSHQFDVPNRGFSFREDAPLDMRMNEKSDVTAARILNEAEEEELIHIFKTYGELQNASRVVRAIGSTRKTNPIRTTKQFNALLEPFAPRHKEFKYFAQAYQALRITVNKEMQVLEDLLKSCAEIVKPGGKIVFLTYHSLEDRLVKNYIKTGNLEGDLKQDIYGNVQKPFEADSNKAATPNEAELEQNNRARSAKLRTATRL